jgi:hypothetical protein
MAVPVKLSPVPRSGLRRFCWVHLNGLFLCAILEHLLALFQLHVYARFPNPWSLFFAGLFQAWTLAAFCRGWMLLRWRRTLLHELDKLELRLGTYQKGRGAGYQRP